MQTLLQLARYNAWANERVFNVRAAASADQLSEDEKGTYGSLAETLAHLVEVEEIYLIMLQDQDVSQVTDDESYMEHDTNWFSRRSAELGAAYHSLLEARENDWLDEQFTVPWFGFPISRRDGLIQVWMHSAQHRAQVLSVLGSHGVDVPDVDYIFMLSLEHEGSK